MTIFGNFDSVNFKNEKNDLAYHIENFPRNIIKKIFLSKNGFLTPLGRPKVGIFAIFCYFFKFFSFRCIFLFSKLLIVKNNIAYLKEN